MSTAYGQIPYGGPAQLPVTSYPIVNTSGAAYQAASTSSYATTYEPFRLPSAANSDSGPSSPGMSGTVAQQALEKMISADLKEKGFDGAEPSAMRRLEGEVIAFIQEIYQRAQEYGNLANRASPTAMDMFEAAAEFGLEPAKLKPTKKRKRASKYKPTFNLIEPPPRSPPPRLLASEDEAMPMVPVTLRTLPNSCPPLPPKHTYLRTPPSPPRRQDGQTRDKKLKNAALVQESLRNLLAQTEDVVDPEDTELLGAIVNWETTTLPRKKWKLHA